MAALTRILQKVFGATGDSDQFGQVGSDSAGTPTLTKNLDLIQSLAQFDAGLFSITNNLSTPPRGEDFNALLFLITSQLKYLFQSGVPEWLATENYYAYKSIVIGSDGNLYKSKTGSDVSPNINHNPVGDTTNWSMVWDITNDGSGSGLDADLVRGTTPGTRGLQYLAAAAVSNIAALILADLKTVDGAGSGLDADLLDGVQGSGYVNTTATQTIGGVKTFSSTIQGNITSADQAELKSYGAGLTLPRGYYLKVTTSTGAVVWEIVTGSPTVPSGYVYYKID